MNDTVSASRLRRPPRRDAAADAASGPEPDAAAVSRRSGGDAPMSALPPFLATDSLLYTPAGDPATLSTMSPVLSSRVAAPDGSAVLAERPRPPGGPAPPPDPRATTPAELDAAEQARTARRRTVRERPPPTADTRARAREGWPVSGEPGMGPTLQPVDAMPRFTAPVPRSDAMSQRELDLIARAEAERGMSLGPEAREAVLRDAALADRSAGDSPAVRSVLGGTELPRSPGDIAAAQSSAAVGDARLASGATEPATAGRGAPARRAAGAAGGGARGGAGGGGSGGDPLEELEDADSLMSDNAAALQLLEEWNHEPYPAVVVPAINVAFNAPGTVELRVPPPPPRPPGQPIEASVTPEAATQQARDTYANTAGLARRWQDEVVSEAQRAMRMLADRADAMAVRIEDVFTPAVDSVTRTLGAARTELARAAEASAREIEVDERRARRAVGGATSSGRSAISSAAAGAVAQLPGIRNDLRQRFELLYESGANEIDLSGIWAERELKSAAKKDAVRDLYPDTGTASARAAKEAQRSAVDEQMDRLATTVRRRSDGEVNTMRERINAPGPGGDASTAAKIEGFILGVRQHITGRAPPPPPPPETSVMEDTSGTALEQRGVAAVNRSQGQALQSLRRQGQGARRTLRMAERSGRQQLATQRRAALTQLSQMRRARRDMLQQAVMAALRTVSSGIQAGAAAYGDSTRRLAEGLEKSAAQGPAALVDSARRSGAQVTQTLGDARRTQLDKLGTVRGGAVNTVERQPQEVAVQATQSGLAFEDSMRGVQGSIVDGMNEQVRAQTRSFIQSADTVRQTTASYTAPMRTQYRQAITDQVTALNPIFIAEQTAVSTKVAGVTGQHKTKVDNPNAELAGGMAEVARATITRVNDRAKAAGGAFGIVNLDENALIESVRGVTAIQGEAVCESFADLGNGDLRAKVEEEHDATVTGLNDEEYRAITNYLAGRTAEGALAELETTVSIWGNDGRRAEAIMRGLSDDQLRELTSSTGPNAAAWQRVSGEVSRGLYGTDRNVFEALSQDYAGRRSRADAYRLRDAIDTARRNNDADALYRALQDVARADETDPRHPGGDARFQEVQREFAHITGAIDLNIVGPPDQNAAAAALARYVTEDKTETVYTEDGGSYEVTHRITGLDADLARAMAQQGPNSTEANAMRMLRESERTGAPPDVHALDDAVLDPRLNPSLHPAATPEERTEMEAAARRDQEALFQRYAALAREHGVAGVPETTADIRAFLADRTASRFGNSAEDRASADYTRAILTSDRLDAHGAAAAMHSAIVALGTNEDRIHRILSRMSRAEIDAMRVEYQAQYGRDLYTELGVYPGAGALADWMGGGEVSGDERLRVERELMGRPQNDRERAEVALYTNQQQQENRGVLSSALDLGGDQYAAMQRAHDRLSGTVGGSVERDEFGRPRVVGGNFDTGGHFTGDQLGFMQDVSMSSTSAENYSARIDAIASAVTTTIMIVGAVVATIATAGGAGPLMLAAIAGGAGLAGIAANRLISGGRYGWEQAATDLAMTAVQAATAGIGAQLGAGVKATSGLAQAAAARGEMALARSLAQRAFMMNVRNGMITGAFGSAAGAALDEHTWERGIGAGFGEMMFAGLKGGASGGITAAVSNSIDLVGRPGSSLGDRVGALGTGRMGFRTGGEILLRGATRGTLGFAGSFLGHGAEIAIDAGRGRFKGSGGDAFDAMVSAGAQSGLQDLLGGMAEGRASRWHTAREEARSQAAGRAADGETRPAAPHPDEHAAGTRVTPRPAEGVEGPHAAPRMGGDAETVTRPGAAPTEEEPTAPRRAAPTEEDAEAEARAPRAADAEEPSGAATRAPAADEADMATGTARGERAFAEGTAASVPESGFHGRAAERGSPEAAARRDVKGAVRRLLALSGELPGAHLPNAGDPTRLRLPTASGEEVGVRLRVGRVTTDEVAHFHFDAASGEYVIVVSPGARADQVERAIAHELAEIRAGHGGVAGEDVLTPAARRGGGPDERPALSPHDQGRLAELRVIARQIETARSAAARSHLQGELDALVQHLGLTNSVEGSGLRRALVAQALEGLGDARFHVLSAVEQHMPAVEAAEAISAMRRAAGEGGGLVEAELQGLPTGRAEGAGVVRSWHAGGETAGEARGNRIRVEASNRAQAREEFGRMLQAALLDPSQHNAATLRTMEYLTPRQIERVIRTGELPRDFPFHHLLTVAEFPEFAHRGDSGLGLPERVHLGEGHGDNTRVAPQAATLVRSEGETELGFQHDKRAAGTGGRITPRDIAEGRASTGRDSDLVIEQRGELLRMEANLAARERRAGTAEADLARTLARPDPDPETLATQRRAAATAREDANSLRLQVEQTRAGLVVLESLVAGGAASRIIGSDEMQQQAARTIEPADEAAALRRAVGSAIGRDGLLENARVGAMHFDSDAQGPFARVSFTNVDGEIITTTVRVGTIDGTDVAQFRPIDAHGREFAVTLSDRVNLRAVGRAVGHELGEIRRLPPPAAAGAEATARPNALRPGAEAKAGSTLSPHDHGRLAEARDLTRRLMRATARGESTEVARLQHELQTLAAALGLVHGQHADGRMRLADSGLADDPATRAALATARVQARDNAMLQPSRGGAGDFELLGRQMAQAQRIGAPEVASELMHAARERVRAMGALDADANVRARAMDEINRAEIERPGTRAVADEAIARERAAGDAQRLGREAEAARGTAQRLDREALEARIDALPEGSGAAEQRRVTAAQERARQLETDAAAARTRADAAEEQAGIARRVADRPAGASVADAAAGRVQPLGPSGLRYHSEHPGSAAHAELMRQRYGDQPSFVSWQDYFDAYLRLNPSVASDPVLRRTRYAERYESWLAGTSINPETGLPNALGNLRVLPRGPSDPIAFGGVADLNGAVTLRRSAVDKNLGSETDALATARLRLHAVAADAATDPARAVALNAAASRIQALEGSRPTAVSAGEALADYNALRLATEVLRGQLAGADPATKAVITDQLTRLGSMINVRSEVLGTVAGRAFAAGLSGTVVPVAIHTVGANAPDMALIVNGRVTIIECKGGDAELGTRQAMQRGETVLAPQSSPEGVRSLANDMLSSPHESERVFARQILDALDAVPPQVDYYVVNQPVTETGTPGPIAVRRYPITRSGRD